MELGDQDPLHCHGRLGHPGGQLISVPLLDASGRVSDQDLDRLVVACRKNVCQRRTVLLVFGGMAARSHCSRSAAQPLVDFEVALVLESCRMHCRRACWSSEAISLLGVLPKSFDVCRAMKAALQQSVMVIRSHIIAPRIAHLFCGLSGYEGGIAAKRAGNPSYTLARCMANVF